LIVSFSPPQGKKQKETTSQTLTSVQQQIHPKRNYTLSAFSHIIGGIKLRKKHLGT